MHSIQYYNIYYIILAVAPMLMPPCVHTCYHIIAWLPVDPAPQRMPRLTYLTQTAATPHRPPHQTYGYSLLTWLRRAAASAANAVQCSECPVTHCSMSTWAWMIRTRYCVGGSSPCSSRGGWCCSPCGSATLSSRSCVVPAEAMVAAARNTANTAKFPRRSSQDFAIGRVREPGCVAWVRGPDRRQACLVEHLVLGGVPPRAQTSLTTLCGCVAVSLLLYK